MENNELNFNFVNESGPMMVAFDVTGACNFKCLHCYNDSGCTFTDELTDEEVMDVAEQIKNFNCLNVCICGGEPLMRRNVVDIVERISKNACFVNMVSNGSLMTQDIANKLKAAGLHTLQISIDGSCAVQHDTFRGFIGSFEKTISAIKYAKNAGLDVVVSCTPNKLNIKSINDVIDMCKDLGVSSVRFMPLIPMGRGSKIDSLLLTPEEYLQLQLNIQLKREEYKHKGFHIEWGDPLDHYMRMPANAKIGRRTYSMEVKANGNIGISTYIPVYTGNVRDHSLQEYWDKGFKNIWADEELLDYVTRIRTIYDINQLEPKPFSGDSMFIDIIRKHDENLLECEA